MWKIMRISQQIMPAKNHSEIFRNCLTHKTQPKKKQGLHFCTKISADFVNTIMNGIRFGII